MKLVKKYTIMFVPFNQNKVFKFSISNIGLLLSGVVLFCMLSVVTLAFLTDNSFLTLRESYHNNSMVQETISLFGDKFKNNQKNYETLRKEMEKFVYTYYPVLHQRYYSNPSESVLDEIDLLVKMLESFSSYQQNLNQFFTDIPSIFPIVGGGRVTSGFGTRIDPFTMTLSYHNGVDIPKFPGSPIKAAASGKITLSGWMPSMGFAIRINHNYGFSTVYMHMISQPIVGLNQEVKQGQIIGYVGSTGRSVGYHLHYEVHHGDKPINPIDFLFLKQ